MLLNRVCHGVSEEDQGELVAMLDQPQQEWYADTYIHIYTHAIHMEI